MYSFLDSEKPRVSLYIYICECGGCSLCSNRRKSIAHRDPMLVDKKRFACVSSRLMTEGTQKKIYPYSVRYLVHKSWTLWNKAACFGGSARWANASWRTLVILVIHLVHHTLFEERERKWQTTKATSGKYGGEKEKIGSVFLDGFVQSHYIVFIPYYFGHWWSGFQWASLYSIGYPWSKNWSLAPWMRIKIPCHLHFLRMESNVEWVVKRSTRIIKRLTIRRIDRNQSICWWQSLKNDDVNWNRLLYSFQFITWVKKDK